MEGGRVELYEVHGRQRKQRVVRRDLLLVAEVVGAAHLQQANTTPKIANLLCLHNMSSGPIGKRSMISFERCTLSAPSTDCPAWIRCMHTTVPYPAENGIAACMMYCSCHCMAHGEGKSGTLKPALPGQLQ